MKALLGTIAVLGMLLLPAPAGSTTTVLEPLAIQVRAATVIAVATIEETRSEWQEGRIVTWVTARVETSIKGGARGRLVIAAPGGTVGGVAMKVMGAPSFAAGDRAILFASARGPGLRLVGLAAGKLPIERLGSLDMVTVPLGANQLPRRVPLDVAVAAITGLAGGVVP